MNAQADQAHVADTSAVLQQQRISYNKQYTNTLNQITKLKDIEKLFIQLMFI